MSEELRGYRRTHRGQPAPLIELRRYARTHPQPDPPSLKQVSEETSLPAPAVRSAISFYSSLNQPTDSLRVCRGTSCHLAGSPELHGRLQSRTTCCAVHCLGYCDRSPALLRADDRPVLVRDEKALDLALAEKPPPLPPPPSIQCHSAEAIITERIGQGDFSALRRAQQAGAYEGLKRVLAGPSEAVLDWMERSGQRGRGGAGFSTGRKWRACAQAPGDQRYVIANGEEGDPGSFIDRVLMEMDPHAVLEGLAICAYAVGATEGIVFIRSEYPTALQRMQQAIDEANAAGVLGASVLGSGFRLKVSVFPGMGSYVCGEETALLNALEGFRGEVRLRPPYPAVSGLYGRPTVVNNVETLVSVPWIARRGAEAYAVLGTAACSGTKAMCMNHGFAAPGIYEIEFGLPLRQLIEALASGGAGGASLEAVLLGGPMGSVLRPDEWDVPICYEAMSQRGIQLGHGGLVAVPEGTDFAALLRHWLHFLQQESCGRCVPCREGSRQALELAGPGARDAQRRQLERLLEVIGEGSLCAFGQQTPEPVKQIVHHFGDRIFGALT